LVRNSRIIGVSPSILVKNILKLWITFRSLLCRVSLEQLRKGLTGLDSQPGAAS